MAKEEVKKAAKKAAAKKEVKPTKAKKASKPSSDDEDEVDQAHVLEAIKKDLLKKAKENDNTIEIKVSQQYEGAGYYFRFPNTDFDVVGFSDEHTTPDKFRQVLQEQGIEEAHFHGAFVYMSTDYPLHDRILLIGDAGGFANRTTFEGLYNAFATARNASIAIKENKPFREVNSSTFRKMKREVWVQKFFYSKTAFFIIKRMCRFPKLAAACMNLKLQHEGFL